MEWLYWVKTVTMAFDSSYIRKCEGFPSGTEIIEINAYKGIYK